MAFERTLKSYDDIAAHIVREIRLNAVDNLPDEFFDALGNYGWQYQVVMPVGNAAPPVVRHEWYPPNKYEISFLDPATGMITARFVYTRVKRGE